MKKLSLVLFFAAWAMSSFAWADNGAKIEAEKLLEAMNAEMIMQQSMERMLDLQIRQNQNIAPLRAVMLKFLEKHMSYKSIKQDLIDIYAAEFNEVELSEMRKFYETPTGKKAIEKMPLLMSKGGEIGSRRVQENMGELQQLIKQELEKTQSKQ